MKKASQRQRQWLRGLLLGRDSMELLHLECIQDGDTLHNIKSRLGRAGGLAGLGLRENVTRCAGSMSKGASCWGYGPIVDEATAAVTCGSCGHLH